MAKIPPIPTVASVKTGQYFEQRKKGEMSELKSLLSGVINTNDTKKGRQVVKKIIGYMTLGMDASPVFSEMCRASFMNDEVMKKMIYFYLTTYAEDNPDLSIMAINTFKKDCKHASAKIRGLALRNLCSFKSSDYVNSVLPTLRQLILDFDPYVKKTAIAGILKVFYHEPTTILNDHSILESLSFSIKQSDPLVSTNAILALQEILVSEGGIPLNKKLFFYLLHRLQQYDSWQQSSIINILYRYNPATQKQQYEIMTLLWQNLKRSSTALVLGSIRIIIKLAKQKQELFKNVVQKIKAPLLTLMSASESNGSYETTFIVLQHIEYVIQYMNGKSQYEKDFKYFYCKIEEPTYIKNIKVKILGMLANQFNLGDMLNELNEYANDIDVEIARKAVHVLAEIGLRLSEVSKALMINLISFYNTEQQHLVNSSMICFYKLLRKYPKLFSEVKQHLLHYYHLLNETQSIKSFIWIVGTFAEHIDEAPYILQDYIENEQEFAKFNDDIKEVLLTQIVQTFVKRPPETMKTLGKIFKLIFHDDHSSVVLADHAAFYYRALKDNPEQVKKGFVAINSDMTKQKQSINEVSAEDDFNTLGIVYKKKQAKFIKNYEHFQAMRNKELGLVQPQALDHEQQEEQPQQQLVQPQTQTYEQIDQELIYKLQEQVTMTAEEFEETWNNLEAYNELVLKAQNQNYLDEESVEELFKMWRLNVMASADQEDQTILKFYMYAKHNRGGFICIQLQINKKDKQISLMTKACHENLAISLNHYIQDFLAVNEFVIP